jgi:putative zinc finger protein
MQEFAPMKSRLSGNHPSDEELAAYIDRGLVNAEADRIAEHLVSCERCYEIYSETVRLQLDGDVLLFPSAEEQRGRAARRRAVIPLWLPFAALLLLSVGSGGYLTYVQLLAKPELTTSPAAPPLASIPPGNQPLWLGPTYRGGEGEAETKINEASFRMGVQVVNLQATLQAGQVKESQDVIARILNLLKPQPFTDDFQKGYIGITNAVEKSPPANLLPEAARLAKESRDVFDTPSLDLGQWVEAGRLAAMARKPSFFQQSDNRAFLRRLRWNDKLGRHEVKLDPITRESLDRISEVVSKGDLRPSDYAKLETQLEKILEHYYPMS